MKVVRARDADQLAMARQVSASGTSSVREMVEIQRMQLEQEQLKYLQTLRTGKPASPVAASGPKEGAHLEAVKITQQMEELRAFQKAVVETADEFRPKSNPYAILDSKLMEGLGQGLGSLLTSLGQEALRVRRERGTTRGPIVGGTASNIPAAPPPRLAPEPPPPPPPPPSSSGFIGAAKEDIMAERRPISIGVGNPGNPGPMAAAAQAQATPQTPRPPIELKLSESDKEIFAKTQRMVQMAAEMSQQASADVRALAERITKLEGGRESGARGSAASPEPVGGTSVERRSPDAAVKPVLESDANAAMELAAILADQGIESQMTPRFKLMGKPVTVMPTKVEKAKPKPVREEKPHAEKRRRR